MMMCCEDHVRWGLLRHERDQEGNATTPLIAMYALKTTFEFLAFRGVLWANDLRHHPTKKGGVKTQTVPYLPPSHVVTQSQTDAHQRAASLPLPSVARENGGAADNQQYHQPHPTN